MFWVLALTRVTKQVRKVRQVWHLLADLKGECLCGGMEGHSFMQRGILCHIWCIFFFARAQLLGCEGRYRQYVCLASRRPTSTKPQHTALHAGAWGGDGESNPNIISLCPNVHVFSSCMYCACAQFPYLLGDRAALWMPGGACQEWPSPTIWMHTGAQKDPDSRGFSLCFYKVLYHL